jgi:hypothetical protein
MSLCVILTRVLYCCFDVRERDPCETMPHTVSPELNDLFRKILAKDVDSRYRFELLLIKLNLELYK